MDDMVLMTVKGRLGKDPERGTTKNGGEFVRFRVAASKRVKDPASGEWRNSDPTWIGVTVWNRDLAKKCDRLVKGQEVYVSGRFSWSSGKDGAGAPFLNVDASELFLGFPPKGESAKPVSSSDFSDEIPF